MKEKVIIPSCEVIKKGVAAFKKNEPRDPIYNVATFLVKHFWGKPAKMAEGIGVLLLIWNKAFYRYGDLNFDNLENFIQNHLKKLSKLKKRKITNFTKDDERQTKNLFNKLLNTLKIKIDKSKVRKSPVATVKALHLLAPDFFPLWDNKIAEAYGCKWKSSDEAAEKYIKFCYKNKKIVQQSGNCLSDKEDSILRLIDEYNYAKYTQNWI